MYHFRIKITRALSIALCIAGSINISLLLADTITIFNQTETNIYVAAYTSQQGSTKRSTQSIMLLPKQSQSIERQEISWYDQLFNTIDQNLYIAFFTEDLHDQLAAAQANSLPSVNINKIRGSKFFIAHNQGQLCGYNQLSWKLFLVQEMLRLQYQQQNTTQVRIGKNLSSGEMNFRTIRATQIQTALSQCLNKPIINAPCIALAGSGGGCRALLAMLGFLQGADQIGLLNASMYIAGSSGSSWMIAPWMASQLSLPQFQNMITQRLQDGLYRDDMNYQKLAAPLLKKIAFNQPISSIDFFGELLGQMTLAPICGDCTFSKCTQKINSGATPYPLCCAVIDQAPGVPYEWLEFTPHEIGSDYLQAYVPTTGFGRAYTNGASLGKDAEVSLGYCMGIWGSAFSANIADIWNNIKTEIYPQSLQMYIDSLVTGAPNITDVRFSPAQVQNFSLGIPNSPIQEQYLTLIDTGIDVNLPIDPLLRKARAIDIMIFFDASESVDGSNELVKAAAYAQRHGKKFPTIDLQNIQRPVSIFYDQKDGTVPLVVYLALPADFITKNSFASTINFEYTPSESEMVIDTARNITITAKNQIISAINTWLALPSNA